MHDVAVVGAGWAGLSAAAVLRDAGRDVLVLEKSRGPGGRSATRREGEARFDQGAQYFTARDASFRQQVRKWCAAGLAAEWQPRIRVAGPAAGHRDPGSVTRYVGVPGMNSICRDLAAGLDCRFGTRVEAIEFRDGWHLRLENGSKVRARRLVLSCPAPQTLALLGQDDRLGQVLAAADFQPCISAMVEFDRSPKVDFDAMFVNTGSPLSWVARNAAKPGRSRIECWVLHAAAHWSRDHLEHDADELAGALLAEFGALIGDPLPAVARLKGHRWRFAMATAPGDQRVLLDSGRGLVVAGDWLAGNRIEGAWISGTEAGARLAALG